MPRKKSRILEELKDYNLLPSSAIEAKVDYFLTPYNKTLYYNKYMKFDSDEGRFGISNFIVIDQPAEISQKSLNDWRKIMEFITSEEK